MNNPIRECPGPAKIELYIRKKLLRPIDYTKIEGHLQCCEPCREKFIHIKTFYNILSDEIRKPVGNDVFQLTKNIEKDRVLISGILLQPQLLDEMPGERHFTAKNILCSHHSEPIELDFVSLKKDEVLIRAIQSADSKQTTLFLYAKDASLYSGVRFTIPRTAQTFYSDKRGKIEVGLMDVDYFDELEIMIIPKK